MGEMVASALAQEGVCRVSSYISTKLDDKASRAHTVARLEMALSRLEFVLERTGKLPITHVSLLRRRKILNSAYVEGTSLLNKHKLGLLEGQETGQVAVMSSAYSFLQRIARRAVNVSITSLFGWNKEDLSSSADQFEWYADCADKFLEDVESGCPLRRDIFFRCPFVRQLFEGKTLRYERRKGSQQLCFHLLPLILEGRGIEACLRYSYFDPERLDKSLHLNFMLRLSESTDIVGIAISCLLSSSSLLNLVAVQDAVMGELTLLSNLQDDISYSCGPIEHLTQEFYAFLSRDCRSDPVCCHANVYKPGVKNIISSDLSHIFPEQVIQFDFTCYIPPAEYSLPRASNNAGGIRNTMRIDRTPPLKLSLFITPHWSYGSTKRECCILKGIGNNEDTSPYGSIQKTIDTARSEAMECLLRQPEVTKCRVSWWSNHGHASFKLKKPGDDIIAAVASTRGRYNTRSAAKRKR